MEYTVGNITKDEIDPFKVMVTIVSEKYTSCSFETTEQKAIAIHEKYKQKRFELEEFITELQK
jgi:hypothetical protein